MENLGVTVRNPLGETQVSPSGKAKHRLAEPQEHSLIGSNNNRLLARMARSGMPSDMGKKENQIQQ